MDTEHASPRYSDIDLWEPADILDAMIEGQMAAVAAVRAERGAVEQAARAMEARLRGGGRLIYAGAGTSGRLAVQDGAELIPTFNWPANKLLLLMAGGKDALLRSAEGAEDETDQALNFMRQHRVAAADVVIAVAASGTTPFTLACLREARQRGALTIGIANNRGTPILEEADCPIRLDTGAEPIAGSTRMKAGTAQRVTLNILSSLVMIRLGRVHEGLMVDVQAINAKLVRRSERILPGCPAAAARKPPTRCAGPTDVGLPCCCSTAATPRKARGCSTKREGGCGRRSQTSAGGGGRGWGTLSRTTFRQ